MSFQEIFHDKATLIESWFKREWLAHPAPFYSSVDIRNAGFKAAAVDTNLFPAGFNNLHPDSLPLCSQQVKKILKAKKILLIPENFTRNTRYFENIELLKKILMGAGLELSEDLPDVIILNTDLINYFPDILKTTKKPIFPSPHMGWQTRKKSQHFNHYHQVVTEFAELLKIDPWLFSVPSYTCTNINFKNHQGTECLQEKASLLFKEAKKQYEIHQIDSQPFVVIKPNSGSYGMGVKTFRSEEAIAHLNHRERAHMHVTKGHQEVHEVLIQEGIPTIEKINQESAEPVIYLIGSTVVGGFYRIHPKKKADENLNKPGMHFQSIKPNEIPYLYNVVARLGALAAAREQKNT